MSSAVLSHESLVRRGVAGAAPRHGQGSSRRGRGRGGGEEEGGQNGEQEGRPPQGCCCGCGEAGEGGGEGGGGLAGADSGPSSVPWEERHHSSPRPGRRRNGQWKWDSRKWFPRCEMSCVDGTCSSKDMFHAMADMMPAEVAAFHRAAEDTAPLYRLPLDTPPTHTHIHGKARATLLAHCH